MLGIHFICPERANLHEIEHPVHESGDWDVTAEDAASLVGGMLYLHKTKKEPSYFGGKIESFRMVTTDNSHSQRVIFRFTFVPEAKNQKWRGTYHARAWKSGLVEL
ncbi:MAG TPA: hypothetical protein VNU00_04075 [Candidatus Binataceae bacterium]|jgi:hypothetical protein|nr:hypothetical protein [Candidatus Binataceae bacterium]